MKNCFSKKNIVYLFCLAFSSSMSQITNFSLPRLISLYLVNEKKKKKKTKHLNVMIVNKNI